MPYSLSQLHDLATNAGFTGNNATVAAAIAMAESGGKTGSNLVSGVEDSRGLWQINTRAWKQFDAQRLYEPEYNASAAFTIWQSQGFWPWSSYKALANVNHGVPVYLRYMPGGTDPGRGGPHGTVHSEPTGGKWELVPPPTPPAVVKEAYRLLDVMSLGQEQVEDGGDGYQYKYVCETHPPDAGIGVPHKGVTVWRRPTPAGGSATLPLSPALPASDSEPSICLEKDPDDPDENEPGDDATTGGQTEPAPPNDYTVIDDNPYGAEDKATEDEDTQR